MTHYETLGVERGATKEQIKAAYRRLAPRNHPDKGGSDQAMAALNMAYETLSDDDKRKRYDENGESGVNETLDQQGRQAALLFFMRAFDACQDESADIVEAAKHLVGSELNEILDKRHKNAMVIGLLKSRRQRFKLKSKSKESDNFLASAIDQRISLIQMMDEGQAVEQQRLESALRFLDQYRDNPPPPPRMQATTVGGGWSTYSWPDL